jgi:hypothetical protein
MSRNKPLSEDKFRAMLAAAKSAITANWRRSIVATDLWDTSEAERQALYKLLLEISWLSSGVRRAILKVLGRSYQAYKAEFNHAWAETVRVMIAKEKARLKEDRKRPKNRRDRYDVSPVGETAEAEIAHRQGMSVDAMKKRLQRHRKRRKK